MRDATAGEATQDVDFASLPGFPGYQLRRTQARIFQSFQRALADLELTPGGFGVLALIDANPGITPLRLARAFGIEKSTLTPVLHRLEQRGLVTRRPLARDRRHAALYIDETSRDWLTCAFARLEAFEAGVAARLQESEHRELMRLLRKLRQDGDDDAPAPEH